MNLVGKIVKLNLTANQQIRFGGNHENGSVTSCPAIVTAQWGDEHVNLKAISDSEYGVFWVTSAKQGSEQGEWEFYED